MPKSFKNESQSPKSRSLSQSTSPTNHTEKRIARLITACLRCRLKKIKCDRKFPSCSNCEKSKVECVIIDPASGEKFARVDIFNLQEKLDEAYSDIDELKNECEEMKRQLRQYQQPVSSNVLDNYLRKEVNNNLGTLKKHFPQFSVHKYDLDSGPNYNLPNMSHAKTQTTSYFDDTNIRVPIFHREHFIKNYFGLLYETNRHPSQLDPYTEFRTAKHNGSTVDEGATHSHHKSKSIFFINMIMAIQTSAEQQMNAKSVSDSYYFIAYNLFDSFWKAEEDADEQGKEYARLETLQALLLFVQYSLLRITTPGAWYYMGICIRLCQDMNLHINSSLYDSNSELVTDTKRRLFWSCFLLDRQVSIFYNRPFGIDIKRISCGTPSVKDDLLIPFEKYQLKFGISEEWYFQLYNKKDVTLHFIDLGILQTEVHDFINNAANIKLAADASHIIDFKEWKQNLHAKLLRWYGSSPNCAVHLRLIFELSYHQLIIDIYGPSPITHEIDNALEINLVCVSSKSVISIFYNLAKEKLIGSSWVALHSIRFATSLYISLILNTDISGDVSSCTDFDSTINEVKVVLSEFEKIIPEPTRLVYEEISQQLNQVKHVLEDRLYKHQGFHYT